MIIIIIKGVIMKKFSKQRELILENVRNRCDHPTAETLYEDVKKEMPELGIATVYRNLAELCKEGTIIKVKSAMGPDHYDANLNPHFHFLCESCGKVEDIFMESDLIQAVESMKAYVSKNLGAKMNGSHVAIHGVCQECLPKQNDKN